MRRLQKLSLIARVLLFCAMPLGPLYASRLNPVSWSLQADQQKVAPGSTILLRLRAQIADGYHLYSFTTPGGGPIKTTASLQSKSSIKDFRVYQPRPERYRDPNLIVPVETFKGGIDFLLSAKLANDSSTGDKIVTASVRYQACSDQICLPPVTTTAATSHKGGTTGRSGHGIDTERLPACRRIKVGCNHPTASNGKAFD
jgi:Disulphide bond corrector protein DsbC